MITGRSHHPVGFGVIAEQSTGYPGYDAVIGRENATIGEILKQNGYATSWFGKNHNTPGTQYSLSGPFDQWPSGMGFEYFYGFMGGETDQWKPWLFRDHTQIFPWIGKPGYNLTTDMADDAIKHIKGLNAAAPDQPFFVYYVPGGAHAPHQPTQEWIDKFKGKFDMGWNALREQIFANQKRLGVIPANTELTPWPDGQPEYGGAKLAKWETLTADEKRLFARQAEVFAAYVAYTDYEIGRVIQAVKDVGKLDNTLIIFISGDNGTSAEGSTVGTPFDQAALEAVDIPVADQLKYYDVWGSDKTQPHMAVAWAWAFDTPFKWTKQIASHFGGTRQGMAISWPGHIDDVGGIRTQFHHLIDIVPTILEATGIVAPRMVNGIAQRPIEGVSMAYTFDKKNANAPSTRTTQYFEMFGNRAIYHDGWIATTTPPEGPWLMGMGHLPDVVNGYKWELYNIAEDYSENNDLAAKMPDKLRSMQELFLVEAAKYNVFPLDNSILSTRPYPATEPHRRQVCLYLFRRSVRHTRGKRPQHHRQVLLHLGRGGHSAGRVPRGCSIRSVAASAVMASTWSRASRSLPMCNSPPNASAGKVQMHSRPASIPSCLTSNTTVPVSARAAPASCRWMARKSPARRCHTPFRFSSVLTSRSTWGSILARASTTTTTRCRSGSPASWTS